MSSPSILVGNPVLTKNSSDGSISCSFTVNFVTLPPSLGGPGYSLLTYLTCQSGETICNWIDTSVGQGSTRDVRQFGMLESQHLQWTTNLDPPDGSILNGTVALVPPFVCPTVNIQQTQSITYFTVELILQQNRIHNAVRQRTEYFLYQTVQVP
jgi:hypothetical protein